jgi:hypothetical protein
MTHADLAVRDRSFDRPVFSAAAPARAATGTIEFTIHHDLAAVEPVWREMQAQSRPSRGWLHGSVTLARWRISYRASLSRVTSAAGR